MPVLTKYSGLAMFFELHNSNKNMSLQKIHQIHAIVLIDVSKTNRLKVHTIVIMIYVHKTALSICLFWAHDQNQFTKIFNFSNDTIFFATVYGSTFETFTFKLCATCFN